jgi:hypothetical protein
LRQVLTAFGSGLTQVAADGSDAQLQDAAGIGKVLGSEEAINQWSAIEKAAGSYLAQATVDAAPSKATVGGQP